MNENKFKHYSMFIKLSKDDLVKLTMLTEGVRIELYEYRTKNNDVYKVRASMKDGLIYLNNFKIDDEQLEYALKR